MFVADAGCWQDCNFNRCLLVATATAMAMATAAVLLHLLMLMASQHPSVHHSHLIHRWIVTNIPLHRNTLHVPRTMLSIVHLTNNPLHMPTISSILDSREGNYLQIPPVIDTKNRTIQKPQFVINCKFMVHDTNKMAIWRNETHFLDVLIHGAQFGYWSDIIGNCYKCCICQVFLWNAFSAIGAIHLAKANFRTIMKH